MYSLLCFPLVLLLSYICSVSLNVKSETVFIYIYIYIIILTCSYQISGGGIYQGGISRGPLSV